VTSFPLALILPTRRPAFFSFQAFADNYALPAHNNYQENSTVIANRNTPTTPVPQNPAIERCCLAEMRSRRDSRLKRIDTVEAEIRADEAYRKALPELVGYENIRDFIACVTHGMANCSITALQGTKLLSGARLALAALRQQPEDSAKKENEHPRGAENHLAADQEDSQNQPLSPIIS
jgi:hypothetical protein